MNFLNKSRDILTAIQSYRNKCDGWKEEKSTKDVTVWSMPSPDWNGTLYKAEGLIYAAPETVFRYVEPTPDGPRVTWDRAVKSLEMVEKLDQDTAIVRTVTHSAFAGVVASRDFVDLAVTVREDGCISTNAANIQHTDCPPTNDTVRGINHPCSIACHAVPQNSGATKVVSFFQSDLCGRLPQNIVEMALPTNIVNFYTSLRKALEDGGLIKVNGSA